MIPGSATPLLLAQSGDDGYKIDRSLRFNSADSAYLNRTPSSAGNRRTWTLSFWVKRHRNGGNPQQIFGQYRSNTPEAQNRFQLYFDGSTDKLEIHTFSLTHLKTDRVFRDNSAWYHIVLAVDTTLSTANNRMRLYVNGAEETSFATRNNPSQNLDLGVNTDGEINIGTAPNAKSTYYADVNLADVHFIDGQAVDPSAFGEYDDNNVWQAKKVSITSPNDGTVWSSALTSSGTFYTGAQGVQSGFDGDTSTYVQNQSSASAPNSITFTPSGGITHASSVEVYLVNNQNTVSYNGGSAQTLSANAWRTVASGSGTLTSLVFERNSTSGASFAAIRVDGVILVDGANEFGRNGFHLDFSDNSSNSALGYDAAVTQPTLAPKGGFDVVTYTGNSSTQSISSWLSNQIWSGSKTAMIQMSNHALQCDLRSSLQALQ
jgi:hypothetical protein